MSKVKLTQKDYQQTYRDRQKVKLAEITQLAEQVPLIVQDKENTVLQLNEQLQRRENELTIKEDEISTLRETIEAKTRDLERLQTQLQRLDNDLISKDTTIQQYKNELGVKTNLVNELQSIVSTNQQAAQTILGDYQLRLQTLQRRSEALEVSANFGQDMISFIQWLRANHPNQNSYFDQWYDAYKSSPK